MTMGLLASCSTTAQVTNPCDVLVKMTPTERTALDIVKNDRAFAQQVAQHKGRYNLYKCGGK